MLVELTTVDAMPKLVVVLAGAILVVVVPVVVALALGLGAGEGRGLVQLLHVVQQAARVRCAPAVRAPEVGLFDLARRVVPEGAREGSLVAEQIGPGADDVASLADSGADHALEHDADLAGQALAVPFEPGADAVRAVREGPLRRPEEGGHHLVAFGGLEARTQSLRQSPLDARGHLRHVIVDGPEHRRVLLEPRDDSRGVFAVAVRDRGQLDLPHALRPGLVGADGNAFDAQRGQDLGDVPRQRGVEDHDQHAVGAESSRVLEIQVRQTVQRDGGLAAAGAALDHHQARVCRGDQLELPPVDQRGDLFEVFVLDQVVAADAKLARSVVLSGAGCRALTAVQLERVGAQVPPRTGLRANEGALRRADAAERTFHDAEASSSHDLAGDLASAKDLVVAVALVVAVVQATDRRIAPVDDSHAALGVEVSAPPNQDLPAAAVLFENQAAEVRRFRIDVALGHRALVSGEHLESLHLLDQRWHVFEASDRDLVAEPQHLRVVVDGGALGLPGLTRVEVPEHAREALLFFAHDSALVRVLGLAFDAALAFHGKRARLARSPASSQPNSMRRKAASGRRAAAHLPPTAALRRSRVGRSRVGCSRGGVVMTSGVAPSGERSREQSVDPVDHAAGDLVPPVERHEVHRESGGGQLVAQAFGDRKRKQRIEAAVALQHG